MAKGYVDRLDYCGVAGWVVDDSAPQRPIQVDVLLRGRFCARVPADMFRGDVQQAGHGDGVSGFRFVFPQTLPDEDVAEIAVVTSHSGAAIERSNPMSSFAETLYCGGAFIGSYAADNRQPASAFLSAHYQRHNQRRLEHLASLGLPLASRSVLEAGAGIGDHTSFFLDRGCRVLACEARAENLRLLEERFANHPARERLTTERLDLDDPVPAAIAPHEVVYAYGLLYHLSRPAEALQHLAAAAGDLLLLETVVAFGDAAAVTLVTEDQREVFNSYHGRGCRPTRAWVRATLREHFPHVYTTATQPWHEEFPIDWSRPNDRSPVSRAVFVASRAPIHDTRLVEDLPVKQTRP